MLSAYGADGNLYVAHYGGGVVQVVAPDGTLRAALPGGGPTPTNVAFWQDSLYIAEGTTGTIAPIDAKYELLEHGKVLVAALYVLISVLAGYAAVWLAMYLLQPAQP